MKAEMEIEKKSGEVVSHTFDLDAEKVQELAAVVKQTLLEINSYMVSKDNKMGDLQHTSLKFDAHHTMNIVVCADTIKAHVVEC